ncbi:MAG: hydroxymethylglutaryl-CoA reductase, degradative [Chromatiales bacterium]|nr:MAG: hydroxymethylglutaryl-CoA reductase, degradative [Chromatiales bacterium]
MNDSRISGLYRLGVAERIAKLEELGWLTPADAARLRDGRHILSTAAADHMIENVIGVFGLPLAIAPNFIVNGREHIVPLVVEEPSITAGLSAAAAMARKSGGFDVTSDSSLLIGQVHVTDMADVDHAIGAVRGAKATLIEAANAVHPRLVERGGGVRDIEVRLFALSDGRPLLAVHVVVDTCDAMGANLVNSVCEAIAPEVADLCNGRVALRIISNLADRSLFTARVRYTLSAEERDAIVTANDIACVDPYRAATHNKGVMNGVDALAIATGNDWRAIEAGVHAHAAAAGRYEALTRWQVDADGMLVGEIKLPLKVGTVGGTLANNPAAALGLALTGVENARELAELMAAVGLAQNFAALRALATSGIQAGHMKLHARSLAASAGAPDALFDVVVEQLIDSGEVKAWKAREIIAALQADDTGHEAAGASAAGKVILLGEHGVVYGRHALALPIPDAVRVTLVEADALIHDLPEEFVDCLLQELGTQDVGVRIVVDSQLPFGKGLGSSAAIAVAIARAFNAHLDLGLDDERINEVAFASEKLAHGTPSGIDNTLSTYAQPMLFSKRDGLQIEFLELDQLPPLLIAWGEETGKTSDLVAAVRAGRERSPAQFDSVFDQMDALSRTGADALRTGNWGELGVAMNLCHGLLNAIGVSTPDLERMVALARQSGAVGAKLTGAGGGGSIVALCPQGTSEVRAAMRAAGYQTLVLTNEDTN